MANNGNSPYDPNINADTSRNNLLVNIPPEPLDPVDLFVPLMGSYDSIFRRSFLYAGYNPDLLTSQKTFKIYDDMLTMGAIRAPDSIKRNSVIRRPWTCAPLNKFEPGSSDAEAAQNIATHFECALKSIVDESDQVQDFRSFLYELCEAFHTGFKLAEIVYRVENYGEYKGKLGYKKLAVKSCKQVNFGLDMMTMSVNAVTSYVPELGYNFHIPPEKCVIFTYNPKDGLPHGNGAGRQLHKHYQIYDGMLKFWSIALERFGGPFLVAQYPAGSKPQQAAAVAALDAIRQGVATALPEGVKYEVHQLARGALEGFKVAADFQVGQMAYIILLQKLSTSEGERSGSLALGKVHENTQDIGLLAGALDVESIILNQLARRFVKYNYGEEFYKYMPRVNLGTDDVEDWVNQTTGFKNLVDSGVLYSGEQQIRNKLGLNPMSPEEEKRKEDEKKAEQDMQNRFSDAKLQNKANMSDRQFEELTKSMSTFITDAWRLQNAAG